jgi:hypothetical protein
VSSSYTAETTITVTVDSGSLSASHSLAALSAIDGSSNQLPGAQQSFLRNRIINGDMRIDQRNAGAAVTVNAAATKYYAVDRFDGSGQTADGVYTLQQVTDAPTGFKNSLKATVTTADASIGASQVYNVTHRIEGYNVADLMLGISSTQQFTLSFWVKSSVTGAFGGSVGNNVDLSNPFSYTISAANTWEYKTVTFTSPASGTWDYTTGSGLLVVWSLGGGTSTKGTAGTWANYPTSPTGSVNLISTLSSTWQITGVQLEAGSAATPFERRQYGQEFALCQRYYERLSLQQFISYNTSNVPDMITGPWSVQKRAAPTLAVSATTNINTATAFGTSGWSIGQTGAGGSALVVAATLAATAEL